MIQYFMAVLAAKRNDDRGASAVEYGLLVAAIAALIVVVVFALGQVLDNSFQSTCDKIKTGASATAATC